MATTTTPTPTPTSTATSTSTLTPTSTAGTSATAGAARPSLAVRVLGDTHALGRRLPQLAFGLVLYGTSMGLMLRSGLGLDPWDVFHQGLQRTIGLSVGAWVTIMGALVLLLWIPMRQRPGVGTVANVAVIGAAMDGALRLFDAPGGLPARIALMVGAVLLNGLATGLYIGARLGSGPRDGLMTGLHRRTGRSLRLVRTGIEVTVLLAGILLGGTAGVGTVLYALAIGPLAQLFLPWCTVPGPAGIEGEPTVQTPRKG
ncbi:YitT family protein [Kitasatospora sp. NPDC051170]|uniref:membrane protein YczE n=1 Tax=Kitasatospora sp. NPDC051170 TaxID=3364056 RepID=UPI0037BB4C94